MPRDAMKCCSRTGVCAETTWPYDITQLPVQPPQVAYSEASQHQILLYHAVPQDMYTYKACLAAGDVFTTGISVYSSFESDVVAQTGIVPMPDLGKDGFLGGHGVLIIDYNDEEQMWLGMNSWGESWGLKGYFKLPYAYLVDPDLSADSYQIDTVEVN